MRRAQLHDYVASLVTRTFTDEDEDIAKAILDDRDDHDGGFARLCVVLRDDWDGTERAIERAWERIVEKVDDDLKDRIADGEILSPPVYLSSLL